MMNLFAVNDESSIVNGQSFNVNDESSVVNNKSSPVNDRPSPVNGQSAIVKDRSTPINARTQAHNLPKFHQKYTPALSKNQASTGNFEKFTLKNSGIEGKYLEL